MVFRGIELLTERYAAQITRELSGDCKIVSHLREGCLISVWEVFRRT